MKKILYSFIATLGIFGTTACSDMLESDSSRQLFEATLDQKTDSVFYAYGVAQAMQQLADQYYFQNELRGDLVRTTSKASTHLQRLSSFTADATNKYDSVYLYYKVINNCNYYLAHRDTMKTTGSRNINEYAAIASFRAWTYLQLARQYGSVPYITEPVTTIAQINSNSSMTDYTTILTGEAALLEGLKSRYPENSIAVPTFGTNSRSIGYLNWRDNNRQIEKFINPSKCFIPLNVVLGDIYLELGEYEKAATCYYQYLLYTGRTRKSTSISVNYAQKMSSVYSLYSPIFKNVTEMPVDYGDEFDEDNNPNSKLYKSANSWISSFLHDAAPGDVISYIPMAVNYTMGQTSEIPAAFGYDYYTTDRKNEVSSNVRFSFNCPKTQNIQIVPSQSYCDSARNAQYYYYTTDSKGSKVVIRNARLGDARAYIVSQGEAEDSSFVYTFKPSTAYVPLYRNATVWLHLAEAINRMGYPDAAFAILKDGFQPELEKKRYLEVALKDVNGNDSVDASGNIVLDPKESKTDSCYYLSTESYELLTTKLPFLAKGTINSEVFNNGTGVSFVGIHFHGAGAVENLQSPYIYKNVVEDKIADINKKFSLGLTTYTKDDYINAMEDLLCDEYAMEFAFEGTRYSDLRRIALHKNRAGTYGSGFGDKWLSRMLQNNAAGITTLNCYLPYK